MRLRPPSSRSTAKRGLLGEGGARTDHQPPLRVRRRRPFQLENGRTSRSERNPPSSGRTPSAKVFVLLEVSTRYGTASEELRVDVMALEVPTFRLPVPGEGLHDPDRHSDLTLKPSVIDSLDPRAYSWSVNGKEVSTEREFTPSGRAEAGTIPCDSRPATKTGRTARNSG